ncbi:MAG: hypothetical protein A2297_01830 [Elusimicrobia bacterium RIFOXYB2_FULL_48_7]|nr:MAG: hypothetical protein A2297_01830 [Elusimicrobia bacterium RIFOXYB2_FULL_48_7]
MGEAFVAIADDLNTIYYNPAGLAKIYGEVNMTYLQGLVDTCYASLSFGRRIKERNALGLSLYIFQGGNIEIPEDNSTYRMIRIQDDYLLTVSYAVSNDDRNLMVGANFKMLRSTLIEKYSATAFAGDFGILYSPGILKGVSLGAVVQNVGTELKYLNVGDPLPLTYRVGAAYRFPGRLSGLQLDVDRVQLLNSPAGMSAGVEYFPVESLGLRAGYRNSENVNYFSIGLGFAFNGIGFDYSQSLFNEFQALNQTTFSLGPENSWLFGTEDSNKLKAQKEQEKTREEDSFVVKNLASLLDKDLSEQVDDELKPIFVYISEGYYLEAKKQLAAIPAASQLKNDRNKLEGKLNSVAAVTHELSDDRLVSQITRKGLVAFIKPMENPQDALVKVHYAVEKSSHDKTIESLYSLLKNYYPDIAKNEEVPEGFTLVTYKLYKSLNYIYDGHYDLAIRESREVLDLEPENVLALKRMGSALYCMGKAENKPEAIEKAREIWRKVINLSIDDKEIKEFLEKK